MSSQLKAIYDAFDSLTYAEVEAAVFATLAPLAAPEVFRAVREFGVHKHQPSKTAAIRSVINTIFSRKDSKSRCGFRC